MTVACTAGAVRSMDVRHEPVQPYLIEPKMEQLSRDFTDSTEHIVTKIVRFHIEFKGITPFFYRRQRQNGQTACKSGADEGRLFAH